MKLFISVKQKSKILSDNNINLDKAWVHDNHLGNLIVFFFLIAKENWIIVSLLSKIIIMENMYWTAPSHSETAGPWR